MLIKIILILVLFTSLCLSQNCNNSVNSLLSNPSFENNSSCPSAFNNFNLVNDWVSGNGDPIDYLNECNYERKPSVLPTNGNGYVGMYCLEDRVRYIGQCLPTNLQNSLAYSLNFDISALLIQNGGGNLDAIEGSLCSFVDGIIDYPIEIVLYGTDDCLNLPWSTPSYYPTSGWVNLGTVIYNPIDTTWTDLTINFTSSIDINAIALGLKRFQSKLPVFNQGGGVGNSFCFPYVQFDNLRLNIASNLIDVETTSSGNICTNNLILTSTVNSSGGSWSWFKDGVLLSGQNSSVLNLSLNNLSYGTYTSEYTVNGMCYSEFFHAKKPVLNIDFDIETTCLENTVFFNNISFANTEVIANWIWEFGDGEVDSSNQFDITHMYLSNGIYNAKLIAVTDNGCKDSIVKQVVINKSSTPYNLTNCSCNGIEYSIFPNPSFEENICCPETYSQLNCAKTWVQASDATSDYYNCDFSPTGLSNFSPNTLTPKGSGYVAYLDHVTSFDNMGNPTSDRVYKEYVGACLSEQVKAGESYSIDFWFASMVDHDFTVFGAQNCNELPFSGDSCPEGIGTWSRLQNLNIPSTGGDWQNFVLNFTSLTDISAIALGPPCTPNLIFGDIAPGPDDYFFMDNLMLEHDVFIEIEQTGGLCSNDLQLKAKAKYKSNNFVYQWFKDDIELVGENDTILNFTLNNYGAGEYKMMVFYKEGCYVTDGIVVNNELDVDFDILITHTCANVDNGKVEIRNIRGEYFPPYLYQVNNSISSLDSNFNNLSGGNKIITLTDNRGCSLDSVIVINELTVPIADFTFDTVCLGINTSFIDVSSIAAGNISSWSWHVENTITNSQNNNYTFPTNNLYNVKLKVSSDDNCIDSVVKQVFTYHSPTPNFTFNNTCQNDEVLFVNTSTNSLGSPYGSNYLFIWELETGLNSSSIDPIHTYTNQGVYDVKLIVENENGCVDSITKQVEVYPKPIANFEADSVCIGNTTFFTDLSFANNATITSWQWSFGATNQNPFYNYLLSGMHNVELIVSTSNKCKDTITKDIIIHPTPIIDFSMSNSTIDIINNTVEFTNLSQGATSYIWSFNDEAASFDINPIYEYKIIEPCSYMVNKLLGYSDFGCADSLIKTITMSEQNLKYIPNSFTPNNDNINDVFIPILQDIDNEAYLLQIFNRWGELIFSTTESTKGWDGKYKGEMVKQGTYIYKIKYKNICTNKLVGFTGHINLLK